MKRAEWMVLSSNPETTLCQVHKANLLGYTGSKPRKANRWGPGISSPKWEEPASQWAAQRLLRVPSLASCPPAPQTHCPTWPPAQSTPEPQSPQVMSQLSPLYPRGMLVLTASHSTVSTTHSSQANCSHVPSQIPLSCEELTPGPTTPQGAVMTHPQSLEECQPALAASAHGLGL